MFYGNNGSFMHSVHGSHNVSYNFLAWKVGETTNWDQFWNIKKRKYIYLFGN